MTVSICCCYSCCWCCCCCIFTACGCSCCVCSQQVLMLQLLAVTAAILAVDIVAAACSLPVHCCGCHSCGCCQHLFAAVSGTGLQIRHIAYKQTEHTDIVRIRRPRTCCCQHLFAVVSASVLLLSHSITTAEVGELCTAQLLFCISCCYQQCPQSASCVRVQALQQIAVDLIAC